jgi:hypothetical protein
MDVIRARAIIFLVIDVPKTSADLVVFLLCRSRLRAFVPRLLRAFSRQPLFIFVTSAGHFLAYGRATLKGVLLTTLRLSGSLLALLPALLALALLLSPTLFVGPPLSIGILCGLVLLVLIGHYGLLWLIETGSTIAACRLSDEPVSPIAIDRNFVAASPRSYYGIE